MMFKDDADNRKYVTLLALIADNSGKYDICSLIYDIITGNKYTYFDEKEGKYMYESIEQRMMDIKSISKNSYIDLKKIVNYIKNKHIYTKRNFKNPDILLTIDTKTGDINYISIKFDDVFIYHIIEKYYHGELDLDVN